MTKIGDGVILSEPGRFLANSTHARLRDTVVDRWGRAFAPRRLRGLTRVTDAKAVQKDIDAVVIRVFENISDYLLVEFG